MAKLDFSKMSGAGNDFVVLDNRQGQVPGDLNKFAAKVADRHFGIGADGVLLVEKSEQGNDFKMRYFNADGSDADMCANGARCIALFARRIEAAADAMKFENPAGTFSAKVLPDDQVSLAMVDPHGMQLNQRVEVDGKVIEGHSLNTGVPHFVVPVADIEAAPVFELGRKLRHHNFFGPKGTNVNFVKVTGPFAMDVRTYERGVEDETLACGTGSVASAILMVRAGAMKAPPVGVKTRGGRVLSVMFDIKGDTVTNVHLQGPAEVTFTGSLDLAYYAS